MQNTNCRDIDLNFLGGNLVSSDQAATLISRVTREEVKDVLFSMDPNKAPDPDGFNVHFYKQAWPIIGEEF